MEITRIYPANKQLTAADKYRAVKSASAIGISKTDVDEIDISFVVFYTDTDKKTGEQKTVVSIVTPDGKTFTTNSPYFIETFAGMLTIFEESGEPVNKIKVIRQRSKGGRNFIDCDFIE